MFTRRSPLWSDGRALRKKNRSERPLGIESLERRIVLDAQPMLIGNFSQIGLSSAQISTMVDFNGVGYFGGNLWRTDGTDAGTYSVATANAQELTVVGNKMYFSSDLGGISDPGGRELMVSDGTTAGTYVVKDIYPGVHIVRFPNIAANSSSPSGFTSFGSYVYFAATDSSHGRELWRTDGTSDGTQLVFDIQSGSGDSNPANLRSSTDYLYFTATPSGTSPQVLYALQGSTLTALTSGINVTAVSTAVGNDLFFTTGSELWKTNGTVAGTVLVSSGYTSLSNLTVIGSSLYFVGKMGSTSNLSLFRSDGTSSGTVNIGGMNPANLTNFNGRLYFTDNDTGIGTELYRVDSTGFSTELVADINPGTASSTPSQFQVVGSTLFFSADDGIHGAELCKTDGINSPTLVRDIQVGSASSSIVKLAAVGSSLYFQANDLLHGRELWKSDGTAEGTTLVKDITPGDSSSITTGRIWATSTDKAFFYTDQTSAGIEKGLYVYNGQPGDALFLTSVRPVNISFVSGDDFYFGDSTGKLWKTDGTVAGTIVLADRGAAENYATTTLQGQTAFLVRRPDNKLQVWKTDGTVAGTQLWVDTTLTSVQWMREAGGKLFLSGYDSAAGIATGNELWVTDGSSPPTLVQDIWPGTSSGVGLNAVVYGDRLYFNASNGVSGTSVWVVDPATLTASPFFAFNSGSTSLSVASPSFAVANGKLYFNYRSNAVANPGGVWSTDGTQAGTVKVFESTSSVQSFVAAEHGIYFSTAAYNLYYTDGTLSGTRLIRDQSTGSIDYLVTFGDSALFGGNDGTRDGLWWTDGTAGGTYEIAPVAARLVMVRGGQRAFFAGNDGITGVEPWSYEPDNTAPTALAGGPYNIQEGDSLVLSASASFDADPGQTLTYSWDLNGDNDFSDAVGMTPTVSWSTLRSLGYDGNGSWNIRVRVTDSFSASSISSITSVIVSNTAPSASLSVNSASLLSGVNVVLTASDPSSVDEAAPFTFDIDWNGDDTFDETVIGLSGLSISHTYAAVGVYAIKVRAIDKDGGVSDVSQVPITVSDWQVINGDLIWHGSDANDSVAFSEVGPGQIQVQTFILAGAASTDIQVISGVTGQIHAFGGKGSDVIDASSLLLTATELRGDQGTDTVLGGHTSDLIYGDSDGGEGWSDFIDAGDGNDQVFADGSEGKQVTAVDTIFGGDGDDLISADGSEGSPDIVDAGDGNDAVDGAGGNDFLEGGNGDDIIMGGDGAEGGNDTISGGAGRDIIVGDAGLPQPVTHAGGADSLDGGTGQDIVIAGFFVPLDIDHYGRMRDEWTSSRDFTTRVANLAGNGIGPRDNQNYFLIPGTTVFNDRAASSNTAIIDTVLVVDDDTDWLLVDIDEDLIDADATDLGLDLGDFSL